MRQKFPLAIAYATSYRYSINEHFYEPVFSGDLPGIGFCGLVANFHQWSRKANFFFTSSLCVSRQRVIEEKLFFPEGEQHGEDVDLFFRLAESGDIAFLRKSLVIYRLSSENSLSCSNTKDSILPCYTRLIDRLEQGLIPARFASDVKRTYANQLMQIAMTYGGRGQTRKAFDCLVKPYALSARFYWAKTALILFRGMLMKILGS